MKKIFLTSGVILCMACPAMATTDIAANATSDSCVYNVLGSYTGPVSFEAKWDPKISGAITLISDRYETSSSASVASDGNASPDGAPATLYSRYGEGLYDTSAHATAGGATGKVTDLTTDPALTGYTFKGFWTGKAKTGTQVIDYDGTVLPAALVQITVGATDNPNTNSTATWYAGWDPNISGAITLDSSVYPGNDHAQAAKYTTSTSEAVTAANPATVYTVYNKGVYASADDAAAQTSAITALAQNTPSKVGYIFNGFKNADGTVTVINSSGQFTADAKTQITATGGTTTWYAQWTPKQYNVTYAAGTCSGDGRTITDGLTYDTNYTVLGMGNATTYSGVTEPTGYAFQNWTESISGTATGETRNAGYTYSPWHSDGVLTLTANCTAKTHNITFTCGTGPGSESVDGSASSLNMSNKAYDSSFTLPTEATGCTIRGYHFAGWRCSHNLTDGTENTVTAQNTANTPNYASALVNNVYTVTATGTFKVDADVTCNATWAPNVIGLTWTYDGGSLPQGGTPGATSCTYDAGINPLPTTPEKPGYTFNGWQVVD